MMRKSVLTILTVLHLGSAPVLCRAQNDLFTVADSIQLVHFNDPNGRPFNPPVWNISPDGSTALLVTTKGVVASNVVESTLWTLDLRAIARYLEEGVAGTPPSPKEVFAISGQLRAFQADSYGSLITNSRWSQDSKAIYLLTEQKGGRRELDKVDLSTGHIERLSKEGYSVSTFEIDSRGSLYAAEQFEEGRESFRPNTSEVVDTVRGSSWLQLLWPSQHRKDSLFRSDSRGVRSIAFTANPLGYNVFSISPDGNKVVALVPVEETPVEWKAYLPGTAIAPLYRSKAQLSAGTFQLLDYEIVDLRSGSRKPLFGSPSGVNTGYYDRGQVVWSKGGDHALVTNTFLPFRNQTQEEQRQRRKPCAAAYVGVNDGSATCIVFARSTRADEGVDSWAISDLKFGRTEHEVVISLAWRGRHKTECYSFEDGVWSENRKSACEATAESLDGANRPAVRLELEQSLNEPPRLWAADPKNSRRVQIWNPNLQIEKKLSGKASIYHWFDNDKREWTGGLLLPEKFDPSIRYPLVIQTHGFNPTEFLVDGAWATANAARPLVSAGFVVLQIEDKNERYETLEEAKIHINGYNAAIDQLAASGIIDPKRVGIIGFSRTCWYIEESMIESPERFAAAVLADGYSSSYIPYMLYRPEDPTLQAERDYGGPPIGNGLEGWIKSAPGFRLSELRAPLRLQAITPPGLLAEWEIYASLRAQNKAVDMVYFPLGQHILQNPAERMASAEGDVDWFRFWLMGDKDVDSAKRSQYERWEKMRLKEP